MKAMDRVLTVSRITSLRELMPFASYNKLYVDQMDVKIASSNAILWQSINGTIGFCLKIKIKHVGLLSHLWLEAIIETVEQQICLSE